MATASLLANNQQKVLVLEQHNRAGGACHTFQRNGYEFGTGVHYVPNVGENGSLKKILDAMTPKDDPIVWDKMAGDLANRYTLVAGENDEYKQNLMEMFPDEKPAIEKYIKITEEAMASFRGSGLLKTLPLFVTRFLVRTGLYRLLDHGYHRFASKSVQQGLEELTDNKDLQAVLAANFLCYGTDPTRAPFLLQAAMSTGYSKGAYYPRGGPSMIPRKIIKNIMAHGGKVLTKAPVAQILIDPDAKAVTGVELENGDIVKANTVVSDVGLINTATKLLPPGTINLEFAKDASASFGKLHPSVTGVTLFVGLKGDPEVLHLPTGIQWIYPSNDVNGAIDRLRNLEVDQAMNLDPVELPLFVSIPCTTDSEWNEAYPEKSVLQIIMPTPWRWFEKFSHEFNPTMQSHGPEYEEVKTTFAKKMWERVTQVLNHAGSQLPTELADVDLVEVGTPTTFQHYFRAEHGAFYGLDNDMKRYEPKNFFVNLRPKVSGVKGLYLSGQDVLGDGIEACTISGVLAAGKVLGKRDPFSILVDEKTKDQQDDSSGRSDDGVFGVFPLLG